MTSETCPPVSVSRTIDAPPQQLFELLVHSANHPVIDGSGMLQPVPHDVVLTGADDVFPIQMHNPDMGEYEMTNHVVEFELNRRISWEPVMTASARPEHQAGLGTRTGHTWSYDLTPVDSGATLVTETYDCSRAPEWLRQAVRGGDLWVAGMTATLEKLEDLATRPA